MHRFRPSRRYRTTLALLPVLLAIFWITAFPWGYVGHQFINTKAVYHLPGDMVLFIQDSAVFGQHASDADSRKSSDPTEGIKHYIDIDDYPDFLRLPHAYDSVVALYGLARVENNGTLPWATVWCYDSLVAQLSRGDWAGGILKASDLGHYIGDGFQPLHVAVNYDGQLTGNNGIHARYESTMLGSSYYGSSLTIRLDTARYIPNRLDHVFSYLFRSNGLVDSILHADTYAKSTSGWGGGSQAPASYYAELWGKVGQMTLEQMQRATLSLASLWYSAWVDAGLILPTGAPPLSAHVPADFRLNQNFPNPYNPATTITYVLPVGGTVRLTIYSLDGREVATLENGIVAAGEHSVRFNAGNLASGVYLYEVRLGKFSQTRKMLLVR